MHEVIYTSKRAEGISDQIVIDEIVLPAGLKNRLLDITGCLWFSDTCFLQILEGPRDAVEDVYAAILNDDRHTEITTVSSSPITQRSFSRWGMRALQGSEDQKIEEIINEYAPGFYKKQPAQPISGDESLLEQIRAYLVQLAVVEPAPE